MFSQNYVRFSCYAGIISLILILQNTKHLLEPRFYLMLVTIWVCLLFFADFEQRRDHLQQRISHTFQVSPELIQPISTQLGLKPQTLLSLRQPIQLKYTTLKQIDTLLTQLRKDA